MKIYLKDKNKKLIESWKEWFADIDDVIIQEGDIFELDNKIDAVISPSNSFGFLDGGIDFIYSMRFGWELQTKLQKIIQNVYGGELLVGEAEIVETNDDEIPYCISAPTMRVPLGIKETVNAFLAFRAALYSVRLHNLANPSKEIKNILCPGLGTGCGEMEPHVCAKQMREAYNQCILKKVPQFVSIAEAHMFHYWLIN